MKRSIIDEAYILLHKNIRYGEDLVQSLSLLYNAEKIVYIDKSMYNYRMNPKSISKTLNPDIRIDSLEARQIVLDYLRLLKIDTDQNISEFYLFYIKSTLNLAFKIVQSKINKCQKRLLLNKISENKLFIEAINYKNKRPLQLKYKLALFLFKGKHYRILYIYVKTISIIKKIMVKD